MRDVKKVTKDENHKSNPDKNQAYLRYETILETSMDGFLISDTKGNILEVNNAYCKLLGYSRKELLSMNLADVEAMESPVEVQKHIRKLMRSGSHRFETRHRCKDGKLIELEVSANSIKHDHQRFYATG